MNRLFTSISILGLSALAGHTFAGDAVSTAGMAQQNKVMEECMSKQAAANSKMSKPAMQKRCEDQMKAQKDNEDKMSGTPSK
jgi:pentapeptide MXKDX repeat protein